MNEKKKRVYISGGITNVPEYMCNFEMAEESLSRDNYEVVNPAKVNSNLPKSFTHDEYMKVCIAMLSTCDAIYMLKGFEESEGAMEELIYAHNNNMKIMIER